METEAKAEAKGENEGLDTITRIQNEVSKEEEEEERKRTTHL